jgi:hypothetical protein
LPEGNTIEIFLDGNIGKLPSTKHTKSYGNLWLFLLEMLYNHGGCPISMFIGEYRLRDHYQPVGLQYVSILPPGPDAPVEAQPGSIEAAE